MNWKNPEVELPKEGETVWALTQHKGRSVYGIEIISGEVEVSGEDMRVFNNDEIGYGSYSVTLRGDGYNNGHAVAWAYVYKSDVPDWIPVGGFGETFKEELEKKQ